MLLSHPNKINVLIIIVVCCDDVQSILPKPKPITLTVFPLTDVSGTCGQRISQTHTHTHNGSV